MTQNFVSILNAPTGTSDIATSGGVITATGLSPYKANLVNSCTIQRSLVETLQVWSVAMTAVSGSTYSFSIEQVVNGMRSLKTFSYEATSTTGSEIVTAIDGFFGATGNSSTYTTASWGSVKYKVTSSSASVTLTISQVSGEAFPTVANASNCTVTNGLTATTGVVTTGTNTANTTVLTFSKSSHGLVSGNLVYLSSFDNAGTVVNGMNCIVKYLTTSTFSLYYMNGKPVVCGSTTTNATAGSFTLVATAPFGTAALVNDDAQANGSTQTATVTANNYSLVSIEAGYSAGETPNLSTRTAPIHWWVSEDTNGIALLDSIASSYLA